jgi:hypothetical protein
MVGFRYTSPASNQAEEVMRKFALLAAASAGALVSIVVAVPNKVDAMTLDNMAGALNVLATAGDATKPEHIRWCRARYCRGRYHEPPPYWDWGWYRPWPYYPYYNFGTGQSRFGFAH